MTMENAIEVTGLMKRYDGFTLGPLDLEVPEGTVVGLVGANGAGKTTLIKCLLDLVEPDEGALSMLGEPLSQGKHLSDRAKARIGVVLDTCAFTQESRVRDIAQLGRAAYDHWNQTRFDGLLTAANIAPKKRVRDLSRGMGMKLSLAFALSHGPQLLILDEATAGLDPLARDEMLDMLRIFMEEEGRSILMASHITTDLEKLADRIVCIDEGRILFDLSKEAICDEAGIARCRASQIEELSTAGAFEGGAFRMVREAYGVNLLVPDRFAFAKQHPSIPVDRATLDDYLMMTLKGEAL